MAEVFVAEPVDLLTSQEHLDALRRMVLQLGSVVYILADGINPVATWWCGELEKRLPGARVTYLPRHALSGPIRMYGHERLRLELKEGAR